MENKLAQKFTLPSLLAFTAPSCITLVFIALYQMTDAVFVSNFVGETALSALNIVFPIPSIVIAIAIMLATGGSAVIARNMGEGRMELARENFSMIVTLGAVIGVVFSAVVLSGIEPLIRALGATELLYDYCYDYLYLLMLAVPFTILQMLFQTFFITAGKPNLGMALMVLGGVSNIVLDYVFVARLGWGVSGAAIATNIGYILPGMISLLYFLVNRRGTLYLVKPVFRWRMVLAACANGSSEMVSNLAIAIVTLIFNMQMLKYLGENGVAAITIVLYAQFLLTSVFMGFSGGVAPVFSYNYGKNDRGQIKRLFRMSLGFVAALSVLMFALSLSFATPIISVFTEPDSEIFPITYHGFLLFAASYLFTGVNIFASGLFTAFSKGMESALLSFLRTFVFLVASLLILPTFLKVDGVWLAVPVAEFLALIVSVLYLARYPQLIYSDFE